MASLPRRKRGPIRAVQRSVPGSDVVSAVPPQKKTFNNSHNLLKPLIFDPKGSGKMGFVPLKCDQLNSHAEGAMLFNAPEMLVLEKLNVPKMQGYMGSAIESVEDVDVLFTDGLAYNKGIRPSAGPRLLKPQLPPVEPTNPYPDRPAGPGAKYAPKMGTYSVGKLALEQLSR